MTTRRSQLQEDTNYRVLRMLQDNPDLPAKLNHRDLTPINVTPINAGQGLIHEAR